MTDAKERCPICHRSKEPAYALCQDCSTAYQDDLEPDWRIDAVIWAAKRAWQFAGAEVDAIRHATPRPRGPIGSSLKRRR